MRKSTTWISPALSDMLNDSSIDRVMAIDQEWRIIAWNKTAAIISGIEKSEVIGQPLLDIFPQLAKDKEIMNAIFHAFSGRKSFVPANDKLFNRRHYENHFIPLMDEDGAVMGVMNIMHDVAHRIKAEQELQRLHDELAKKYQQLEKASSDLSMLTYTTSNNLKQPVRLLYTSLEQLVRTDGPVISNSGKAKLRKMQSSLNRINLLLDDILAFSQINSFVQAGETINLQKVLEDVLTHEKLAIKIKEKNAQICADILPSLSGHQAMLEFLFFHLIDNGLKFQEPNNTPSIYIKSDEAETSNPAANDAKGRKFIRLIFSDNGIGFNEQDKDRIFIMFEKLHPDRFRGSGLGLAICKKIMDAHDGFITVESEPGKGTTFYCYFPA